MHVLFFLSLTQYVLCQTSTNDKLLQQQVYYNEQQMYLATLLSALMFQYINSLDI